MKRLSFIALGVIFVGFFVDGCVQQPSGANAGHSRRLAMGRSTNRLTFAK